MLRRLVLERSCGRRQAGTENTEEIEVTPEMIAAGESVLSFAVSPEDIHIYEAGDLVRSIYEAMALASSSCLSSTTVSGRKSSGSSDK